MFTTVTPSPPASSTGPAVPLIGRLEAPPAGHSAGQRSGLQRLPTEGGPERQPPGGLWGQDAEQSPADQHNAEVCVSVCVRVFNKRSLMQVKEGEYSSWIRALCHRRGQKERDEKQRRCWRTDERIGSGGK